MENKQIHYVSRAAAERAAAARATDPRARHAHLDLAVRFDQLAASMGEADSRPGAEEGTGHLHSGAAFIQF